jgi:hypothetical protein
MEHFKVCLRAVRLKRFFSRRKLRQPHLLCLSLPEVMAGNAYDKVVPSDTSYTLAYTAWSITWYGRLLISVSM